MIGKNKKVSSGSLVKARRAPYEQVTGQTCCIAPAGRRLLWDDPDNSTHHGNFSGEEHSGSFFETLGDLGLAIADSRQQLTRNIDHNQGPDSYHGLYDWSKISRSEIGQVRILIFGLARAATSDVVDLKLGGKRPITEEERQHLFYSGELASRGRFKARRALTKFTIAHGIAELGVKEASRYKDMRSNEDRRAVVDKTLSLLLPSAFQPINERYSQASELRLLPPSAPNTPAELASFYVMREPERLNFFNEAFTRAWGDMRVA